MSGGLPIGAEVAEALETIERAEEALADVKRTSKQVIEAAQDHIRAHGQTLRQGYEWADVDVEHRPAENWMVERVRLDTGEVLEPRAMTEEERQTELELDGPVGPGGNVASEIMPE